MSTVLFLVIVFGLATAFAFEVGRRSYKRAADAYFREGHAAAAAPMRPDDHTPTVGV
jgi:hypothetical protein